MTFNRTIIGDCRDVLATLPAGVFRCCVTSPPYWGLRDYGHASQIGLESTPQAYVDVLVGVFREVRRVLADDGTLWLNVGDSYAGSRAGVQGTKGQLADRSAAKSGCREIGQTRVVAGLKTKDIVGIPWRLAFALQADGWWLRSDIIWHKPNPMPESVTDRPTKAHEHVFLLAKAERYFYDAGAIAESAKPESAERYEYSFGSGAKAATSRDGGEHGIDRRTVPIGERAFTGKRNARDVWTITSKPYSGAHFATMPPELAQRCILAGSALGDAVLDPFIGSGTVGEVAEANGRRWLGIDLSYAELSAERTAQVGLPYATGGAR